MKTYRDIEGDGGSGVLEQVLAQRQAVADRLENVDRVVAVMSGKGGVGKSTVTVALAQALARAGERVAVLDADLNGPSVPRLLGVHERRAELGPDGMRPPEDAAGIAVMSTGLFLAGEEQPLRYDGPLEDPFTWRPTAEVTTVREFVAGTDWGRRDWMLLDLPPGADRLPNLLGLFPDLDGALVVTLASAVSVASVKKSVTTAREHGVRLLGVVENMAGYRCCGCDTVGPLFGTPEGAERMEQELDLPCLARLPHDGRLAEAAELGQPFRPAPAGEPDALREAHDALADHVREIVKPVKEKA